MWRILTPILIVLLGYSPAFSGTIKGTTAFSGEVSALPAHKTGKYRKVCGTEVPDESLLIENKRLLNVVISLQGKKLKAQTLLYAVGRQGSCKALQLENVGLEYDDRERLQVHEHYQTSVPHIYAGGDVIGFPALASTSMEQGRMAACHAFGVPIHSMPALQCFRPASTVRSQKNSSRSSPNVPANFPINTRPCSWVAIVCLSSSARCRRTAMIACLGREAPKKTFIMSGSRIWS
ncbi:MAG: FAD-dependent oxidoreductase [Nitrospinae bacterium]|nr:FAD-dependent oxidoreductase [Nitrospinota bacterium]